MTSVNQQIEPRRLKGFRDYSPEVMAERVRITAEIRRIARLAGFLEIGTPALEYAEVLLGQGSEETDKESYRFQDHGGRAVSLRFDLTVPFARYVAENLGTLILPFKRLQIGDVWRGEKPQKGRYREFCQCDLDIVGTDSLVADVEILSTLSSTLQQVLPLPFTTSVGQRVVLSGLLKKVFVSLTPELESQALVVIDKLAKVGAPAVIKMLGALPGCSAVQADELVRCLTSKTAAGETDLVLVRSMLGEGDHECLEQLKRLEHTVELVRNSLKKGGGSTSGKVVIDLSIARGLAYYTGVVFETTIDALTGFGSITSGGRYDGLVARFAAKGQEGRNLAGVGGSIGLDRLVAGLEELVEQKLISGLARVSHVAALVAIATDDAKVYGLEIVQELRAQGVAADIGLSVGKVGNQFKYADRRGYPAVITVGTDEAATKTVSIKRLADGVEKRQVPLGDLVAELRKLVSISSDN